LSIYNKSKKSSDLGDAVNGFDDAIQTCICAEKACVTRQKFRSVRLRVFEMLFGISDKRVSSRIR